MGLPEDIKKTIKYAKRFGGELNLKQLYFRLLSNKIYRKKDIKKKFSIFNFQFSKNRENERKIKLAQELVKTHLTKFKNILMVGITGSVAAENARPDEDIDLFIVCKNNTMWWTRLCLRIYIKLHGIEHRRYGQKEKPNDFCFNLWMEENCLTVPKLKQNEKNAVDLILVKPIFNKDKIYEKFIAENSWVKKFVANGYHQLIKSNFQFSIFTDKVSIITILLNYLAYAGQILYIRLKGPVKFINLRQAFFHLT